MGKENLLGKERFLTAPEVIGLLLKNHPEIIQVSLASYPPHCHGESPRDNYREYIPVSSVADDFLRGEWRRTMYVVPEIVAIGSTVDVCSKKDCSHSSEDHFNDQLLLWQSWHDGLSEPCGIQKSFIFLDMEMRGPEILEKITSVLENIESNWFLLHSGGGFHVIIDKLVDLKDVPKAYGEIISFFGYCLDNRRLVAWGEGLKRAADNFQRVFSWSENALKYIGHIDEPVYQEGKEVHIIDLRHVGHSLKRVIEYLALLEEKKNTPERAWGYKEIGGFYLRISPKKGGCSQPVLIAQKTKEGICRFPLADDFFGSSLQLRLL